MVVVVLLLLEMVEVVVVPVVMDIITIHQQLEVVADQE
jgi:hypothetical protein